MESGRTYEQLRLASRLDQRPLDALPTLHSSAAHTSPQDRGRAMRRRVGCTLWERSPCIQGALIEP
jgi:hypothetical protein